MPGLLGEDRETADVQAAAAQRAGGHLGRGACGVAHLHQPPAVAQRAERRDRRVAPEDIDHEVGAVAAGVAQRVGRAPGPSASATSAPSARARSRPSAPRATATMLRRSPSRAPGSPPGPTDPARPQHDDGLARHERARSRTGIHPASPAMPTASRQREAHSGGSGTRLSSGTTTSSARHPSHRAGTTPAYRPGGRRRRRPRPRPRPRGRRAGRARPCRSAPRRWPGPPD